MRYLFRDGRLLTANGKAVTDDCPQECCGPRIGYCRYVRCTNFAQTPCADFVPGPTFVYVHRSIHDRCLTGATSTILFNGVCYDYFGPCDYIDPAETPDYDPETFVPIPDGSTIVRQNDPVECTTGCLDPRCTVIRWVVGVPCAGNAAGLDRPVYVCARNLLGCAVVGVKGANGIVCVEFNPGNQTTTPDPNGIFLEGITSAGTCCSCLSANGGACETIDAPVGNICIPWNGEPVCCCSEADEYCLERHDDYIQFFHCDVRGTIRRTYDPACATLGAGSISTVYRQRFTGTYANGQPNTDDPVTLPTFCIPPMIYPEWGSNCVGVVETQPAPNGDYSRFVTSIKRTCTSIEVRVLQYQYGHEPTCGNFGACPPCPPGEFPQTGPLSLRALWQFNYKATRRQNGACRGECDQPAVTPVIEIPGTGPVVTPSSLLTGGCAGCGGGNRTEIKG
jgi:hypothetical protein